jgi:ATP-dependent DNA helicase RecG
MASVDLYDMENHCPTNAAVILFGIRPKTFIPEAYVQYVKFAGTDKASDILNERAFSTCLFDMLPKLDTFTENSVVTTRPVPVTAFRKEQVVNYPKEAIRELLLNAVMHRDYSSNMPIR